jgi:glutamyl-tRNA synthetase
MLAEGLVPQYSKHCRNLTVAPAGKKPQTIRVKTPEKIVEFKDMVRGTIKFDTETLGDFVIAKDERTALYNFAVVVDDKEMAVSHVIRGEDHISNTPKQMVLQEALGFEPPRYAHLPLILAADRKKLSKRYVETSLLEYREQGYLPQAVANFLVLMGWHPSPDPETKKEQEVWTLEELVGAFDIDRVQKAGAIFNEEKLQWLNREHIKKLSTEELEEAILSFLERTGGAAAAAAKGSRERLHEIIEAVRERMRTLADFLNFADLFFELPDYPPELLSWGKAPAGEARETLAASLAALKNVKVWEKAEIDAALAPLVAEKGKGNVLWPVRVALSGKENSPDPFDIATALGQEEALARLNKAINKLSHGSLL